MSWKGREERKGYTGQKTAADPTLIHGVSPNEEGWDNQVAHSSIFVLAAAGSDSLVYVTYKDDFCFISSFLLQTFSFQFFMVNFLEIHKKAESKINNLLLDSTIFNILLHLWYLHMCKYIHLLILNLDIFTLLYLDIFNVLFIFAEPYFLLKISFF